MAAADRRDDFGRARDDLVSSLTALANECKSLSRLEARAALLLEDVEQIEAAAERLSTLIQPDASRAVASYIQRVRDTAEAFQEYAQTRDLRHMAEHLEYRIRLGEILRNALDEAVRNAKYLSAGGSGVVSLRTDPTGTITVSMTRGPNRRMDALNEKGDSAAG